MLKDKNHTMDPSKFMSALRKYTREEGSRTRNHSSDLNFDI